MKPAQINSAQVWMAVFRMKQTLIDVGFVLFVDYNFFYNHLNTYYLAGNKLFDCVNHPCDCIDYSLHSLFSLV